jgi:hypothetical protein
MSVSLIRCFLLIMLGTFWTHNQLQQCCQIIMGMTERMDDPCISFDPFTAHI